MGRAGWVSPRCRAAPRRAAASWASTGTSQLKAYRWRQTKSGNLHDVPIDEPMQAGNGTGELGGVGLRWRIPCMGVFSYEWINGMGVVTDTTSSRPRLASRYRLRVREMAPAKRIQLTSGALHVESNGDPLYGADSFDVIGIRWVVSSD
jgi:hypothetical protein